MVALTCMLLSACGGGGGGGDGGGGAATPGTTTALPRTPTATPTLAAAVATATFTPTGTGAPSTAGAHSATPTAVPPTATEAQQQSTASPTPMEPIECPATATPPPPTETALPTATETPLLGPEVTRLGLADATGLPLLPSGTTGGLSFYRVPFAGGFVLYVEGRPGATGLPLGALTTNRSPFDASVRPDLQIQVSRPLGNGSSESCDNSAPDLGGVPAIDPPDFSVTQEISDALNDLSCRFSTYDESRFPCTQDGSSSFTFVDPNSTRQFCVLINEAIAFPTGDTVVTARLRDSGGNAGPPHSIVVRVAP